MKLTSPTLLIASLLLSITSLLPFKAHAQSVQLEERCKWVTTGYTIDGSGHRHDTRQQVCWLEPVTPSIPVPPPVDVPPVADNGDPSGSGDTTSPPPVEPEIDEKEQCEIDATSDKGTCNTIANTLGTTGAGLCLGFTVPLAILACEVINAAAWNDALAKCEVQFEIDKARCD